MRDAQAARYFRSAHIKGLQAPSAHQHVHLASILPVASSSPVTQRSFWPSHLQVWSGVKEDGTPKWHCCHLGWTSCSWHVDTQQQCTACSSKSIGPGVVAEDRGSDNGKYIAMSPNTSRAYKDLILSMSLAHKSYTDCDFQRISNQTWIRLVSDMYRERASHSLCYKRKPQQRGKASGSLTLNQLFSMTAIPKMCSMKYEEAWRY